MQGLICLNGDIIRKDTINQMPPGNAKSLMDSVFDLAQRINRFQLSDAEIGLFCAVVIITPGKYRRLTIFLQSCIQMSRLTGKITLYIAKDTESI